jgi:putative Mn2+ efflux pump MntP
MSLPEIILIAVGLSIDAFAVSISIGLSVQRAGLKEMVIPGLYFGFFQALMPAIGYFLGIGFADKIDGFDHWIVLALLGFLGGKLIKESFEKENGAGEIREYTFRVFKMLSLAVATSIDALAIGIAFAFFQVHIITAVSLTGMITFVISMCGVKIGHIFGLKFKSKAKLAGGIVLVLLGIKIAAEHTLLQGR